MGFCTEVRTWKWDFALKFALDTSILTALSEAIPQGKHRLDRAGAVQTENAPSRQHRAPQNAILRCPGLRCSGLGLPQNYSGNTVGTRIIRCVRLAGYLVRNSCVFPG